MWPRAAQEGVSHISSPSVPQIYSNLSFRKTTSLRFLDPETSPLSCLPAPYYLGRVKSNVDQTRPSSVTPLGPKQHRREQGEHPPPLPISPDVPSQPWWKAG